MVRRHGHPRAIGRDGYQPLPVSPPHIHLMASKALQRRWRWMTVFVPAHRNDGDTGTQRVEPFVTRAAAAAMMPDFEQIHRASPTPHLRFGGKAGITGEE